MAGVVLRSEYEGQTLGGILAYREGARAGPHMMASDHTARSNIPRNQGIMWELMRGMRDLGCTEFDMIGYPDDRYDTPEDAKRRGAFKAGFNPLTQRVPPLMVKPLRPVANAIALRLRAIVREARKPRVHKFGRT
jgi:lipid II:glycine glycyltransferase (peptidoglycan interpeptide bridge formation enzyme)